MHAIEHARLKGVKAIFETVDLKEVQKHLGKPIQAAFRKNLQTILKTSGWQSFSILHLSSNRQGGGIPEMLYWWVELFNGLAAGESASARWEVPFVKTAFLEPIALPSGHLVPPDETLPAFFEVTKKIGNSLQQNSRQIHPLSGKAFARHDRLVLMRAGRQTEIINTDELKLQLQRYYQPEALPRLFALKPDEIAAEIITEDDLALYQAVSKILAGYLQPDLEEQQYRVVIVHNYQALGLIPHVRRLLPKSVILWRNHLATVDPTPVIWNFFVPMIQEAQAAVFHSAEYNPQDQTGFLPLQTPVLIHLPSLYPFSPKNRELDDLGLPVIKRVLAQYQRDYTLVSKFNIKPKVEKAYLKLTGSRISDTQSEAMLDSLTKASIRAAFIEEGRRPELDQFMQKAAHHPESVCDLVRELHGIAHSRPLFVQISRYDYFKDPVGTVRAFVRAYLSLVRDDVQPEDLPQFVYGGTLEDDDPGGFEELVKVFLYLENMKDDIQEELRLLAPMNAEELIRQLRRDIFILLLPGHDPVASAIEINALQRTSRAVIQKSLREGFGLAVTEAMWKNVPVIGGNTGGIRLQIDHGINGFLAGSLDDGDLKDSVEDTAQFIITYTKHPDVAKRMGEMAKRKVAKEFLMPFNINLFLKKISEFLAKHRTPDAGPVKTKRANKTGALKNMR